MGGKSKNHVIAVYNIRANTILCRCGWLGDADLEWDRHKKIMRQLARDQARDQSLV